MANYVRNYVFCSDELYEDLLVKDFDHRLFQTGIYDPVGYELKDGRKLVIFDSRGIEYETQYIESIITRFHDTIWYCIEENDIEEGAFWWDDEGVRSSVRELLAEAPDGCILDIDYMDNEWRLLKSVVVFPGRIVIEECLHNTAEEFLLTDDAGLELVSFVDHLAADMIRRNPPLGEFSLSDQDKVWREYYLYGSEDKRAFISSGCSEYYPQDLIDAGERYAENITNFLIEFFVKYGIKTRLLYDSVEEFL